MKKVIITSLAVLMVIGIGILFADPDQRGNGLPKGKSYNFNVIGVQKQKNENFDDNNGDGGKRIFILRTGKTQFYVQGGDNFEIVDHDGTDGKVGEGGNVGSGTGLTSPGIILPYDTSDGGVWDCLVFVRLLGPVDSSFHWTSYNWDDGTGDWVYIDDFTLDRNTKFDIPSGQILKDGYQDILWEWTQKNNYRICQFRIFVLDGV